MARAISARVAGLFGCIRYRRNPQPNSGSITRYWIIPLCAVFFVIDLGFVIANGAKLLQGAWFPVVLGIVLFTMMRTWRRGRELLRDEIRKDGIRIDTFLPGLMLAPPVRVPGTAVFHFTPESSRARHGSPRLNKLPAAYPWWSAPMPCSRTTCSSRTWHW